ncbi:10668_t:CDS:1, partial [Racocetra persica]
ENKKIKTENEENTKENLSYEKTLKNLNSQINIVLNLFKTKYNTNDPIEKKMEEVVKLAKATTEIVIPPE